MDLNDMNKENRLKGLLFPGCITEEADIKKVFILFDQFTIFQPWYMEAPSYITEKNAGYVNIINPVPDSKPSDDFDVLLREYKKWVEQQGGDSYASFLFANRDFSSEGENTWDIRKSIKGSDKKDQPDDNHYLKWHIILHLAREMADQKNEADEILKHLKMSQSPLKDAVDEDITGLFDDLTQLNYESKSGREQSVSAMEAWFGLFGGFLENGNVLVSFNQHIWSIISDYSEKIGAEGWIAGVKSNSLRIPDLSGCGWDELFQIKKKAYETVEFIDLIKSISGFGKMEITDISKVYDIIHDVQKIIPEGQAKDPVNLVIKRFPLVSDRVAGEKEGLLNNFSGKLFIFEENGQK